jgi:hypothetical protein
MRSGTHSSSNGLTLFNTPEEFESFVRMAFLYHPFPGKEDRVVELGKESFQVLDLICEMLVPPKDLSIDKKRDSVNKFLDSKVNDKISKKNNEIHDHDIEVLQGLFSTLQNINENHNIILRGLSKVTEMSTLSSLKKELVSKCGTQIESFEAAVVCLIKQAANDQKDIRKLKDSIDNMVESNTIKNKSVVVNLRCFGADLALTLKSLVGITNKAEESEKIIREFCRLQIEYKDLCLKSMKDKSIATMGSLKK